MLSACYAPCCALCTAALTLSKDAAKPPWWQSKEKETMGHRVVRGVAAMQLVSYRVASVVYYEGAGDRTAETC